MANEAIVLGGRGQALTDQAHVIAVLWWDNPMMCLEMRQHGALE